MPQVPDITDTEQWVTILQARYGRDLPFELADADIRLHTSEHELARCPVVVWQPDDDCTFVLDKTGERRRLDCLPARRAPNPGYGP